MAIWREAFNDDDAGGHVHLPREVYGLRRTAIDAVEDGGGG